MSKNPLGSYLKTLRKEQNYTQEYVASYLDIIRQSYSHYETGRTSPSIETLQKLANLYHVPLNAFLNLQLNPAITPEDSANAKACCDISAEELQLLISFRRLSPQDQEDIITFMKIKASRNT